MEDSNTTFQLDRSIDPLSAAYYQGIRPLIDVIDSLKQFGLYQDIDLPNVVVLGDKNCGKSSIIEAISGIQIPRGKVTLCPLELQLKRVLDKPWKATLSYKTFHGTVNKIEMNNSSEIEENIRKAQKRICSANKDVRKELITLKIESPDYTAPDLKLIDLPGIDGMDEKGKPNNNNKGFKRIIMDHIENKNTLILCVISANVNVQVNESIKIVKNIDYDGKRTLGVITKPDTADDSMKNEIICIFNNEKIRLENGFYMVKCRSQKELENKLSPKKSLENENSFFKTDKYFRTVTQSRLGIMNLVLRIIAELLKAIKKHLPGLRNRISTSLFETQIKLLVLPKQIPKNSQEKLLHLVNLISEMNNEINNTMQTGKTGMITDNLFFKWRKLFHSFKVQIENIKEKEMKNRFKIDKLKDEILKSINNEKCEILNIEILENIIRNHIFLYKTVAVSLFQKMSKSAESIITDIIHSYFHYFPLIESDLMKIFQEQLELLSKKSLERLHIIFEEEKLIFSLDNVFSTEIELLNDDIENQSYLLNCVSVNRNLFQNDFVMKIAKRMSEIASCYLKVVQSRLSDIIPMSIRQCLHIEFTRSLKEKFIEYALSSETVLEIEESNIVSEKRIKLQNKISILQDIKTELENY